MANLATSIELYDRLSAPINNMIGAINNMIGAYQSLDRAMDNGLDPSQINEARGMLASATDQINQMGDYISQNEQNQQRFNNEVREGSSAADGLTKKLMGMVGAYASIQGVQKLFNLSDTAVQTTARLKLILDDDNSIEGLEEKIMASANRARASYQTTADAVAKLGMQAGKAFNNSNDEIIAFAELVNKSFVIAGTSAQGVDSVMLQMIQAMAAGRLQGEELNAMLDNAQPIVANIQKYLEEVQNIDASNIKKLASDGVITAEVIKKAMFYAAKDINEDFESMPMTWSQVWAGVMNKLYTISKPVLSGISFMAKHWSVLEPIVAGLAAAVGLYTGALLINKGIQVATNIAKTIGAIASVAHGAAITAEMTATTGMTAAQIAFNAALYACPLTWVLLIIIAIIAVVYAVIAVINKVTNKTISATGVIAGVLMTAVAFVWNLFAGIVNFILDCFSMLWNFIAIFANFFGNVFNDPIGAIARLFFDLVDWVLELLQSLASVIDTLFGSNLADAVQGWRDSLGGWVDETFGEGEEIMAKADITKNWELGRMEYGDAYNKGYSWGANLESSISDALNMDELLANSAATAENTGKASDTLDITSEDLKYLRDIAERDAINKFTTAEIKVEMTNNNSISNNMDLDGVVDYLTNGVNEAMEKAAEGVHK